MSDGAARLRIDLFPGCPDSLATEILDTIEYDISQYPILRIYEHFDRSTSQTVWEITPHKRYHTEALSPTDNDTLQFFADSWNCSLDEVLHRLIKAAQSE